MSLLEKPKRAITKVFLHCSASNRPNHDDVEVIRTWHKLRGWSDVGYHYFIRTDGKIQIGRDIEQKPAAQAGHNTGTIATSTHRMVVAPIDDFGHFKFKFNEKLNIELQIHIYSYV